MKYLLFLTMFFASTAASQIPDTVKMKSGTVMLGKVMSVKSQTVEFIEASNSLNYELLISDIKSIILASGKELKLEKPKTDHTVAIVAVTVSLAALVTYAIIMANNR